MTTDLTSWVAERIDQSGLDVEPAVIVLSALEGDAELDAWLETGESSVRERVAAEVQAAADAGGTFLSSVTVEGFRGIGPAATLELPPRPGLTIVAGRNGSGKSSFSEALELVLTGGTYRWKKPSTQWKEQWRNLHHPSARVSVRLVEEGSSPVSVVAEWADAAQGADEQTTTSQREGQKKQHGLGQLGWERPLERFRPILSYDELGGMLEGSPSQLHDAIAKVLGTEELSDALKRIQARLKNLKQPGDEATKARKALVTQAEQVDDERAAEAARLLRKTDPDLTALRGLATGATPVDQGPVAGLRRLAALDAPLSEDQAVTLAGRLRGCVADLASTASDLSDRSMARLELLQQALAIHGKHGEMQCPVCDGATLDESWAKASRALVKHQREEFETVETARRNLRQALTAAHDQLKPAPGSLNAPPLPQLADSVAAARAAWDEWNAGPRGTDADAANALADHLELHAGELVARVSDLRVAASKALDELEDVWQPLATRIGTWCDQWDAWLTQKANVDRLTAAEKWLKDNELVAKNERLAPIRDGAKAAWAKLRQESNVEIGNLTLGGIGNRRKVVIDTEVDGTEASSLAVLSQGELHALALALFLPRATIAESPFRFLVLDDPVQAMDPAKVDGLVELLGDLARTHQVVVLSHDDRLAAAVRRSSTSATILEVTRGTASQVSVSTATDPAQRYLDDAFALVKEHEEERLSETALRRTLPGLLRFAAEAAARDRFFTRTLTAGGTLSEAEDAWQSANTTRQRVTLAVFGESRANHELDAWASAPYRKFALATVGTGMHNGLKSDLDPRQSAKDVQRLVQDLEKGAK